MRGDDEMPIPFVAAVQRAVGTRTRSQGDGRKGPAPRTRRALSPRARLIGWVVALIATFGMFMGGAGVVMLLAGHLTATAIALTVAGVVGTVYLVLFLAMDARTSRPTTPPAPRRRVSRPTTGTCSFCGRAFTDEGGLLRSPRATICRSCVEYARATISGTGDQP